MAGSVDQRSPPDNKILSLIWTQVWWILSKIPIGENYCGWLQLRHVINLYKVLSFPYCLLMIYINDCWSFPSCVYAACHGVYGVVWLCKEALYPDTLWTTPVTPGSGLVLFLSLAASFWTNITVLTSTCDPRMDPSPPQLMVLLSFFILGIWLHHTSDCQKYFVLQASPGLITTGLWSHSRNPNYLGELFILGSFAGFGWNQPAWWWSWLMLGVTLGANMAPAIMGKERSLARYPGWCDYTSKSGLIFPNFFS